MPRAHIHAARAAAAIPGDAVAAENDDIAPVADAVVVASAAGDGLAVSVAHVPHAAGVPTSLPAVEQTGAEEQAGADEPIHAPVERCRGLAASPVWRELRLFAASPVQLAHFPPEIVPIPEPQKEAWHQAIQLRFRHFDVQYIATPAGCALALQTIDF